MIDVRSRRGAMAIIAAVVLAGCPRWGCGAAKLAELTEAQGSVERDFAASVGTWQHAEQGAGFDLGDGLRTGKGASALLRIGAHGRARVESETTIRFTTGAAAAAQPNEPATPTVSVEQGVAELEAVDDALPIQTPTGRALLQRGTRVQLTRAPEPTPDAPKAVRYRILFGGASFTDAQGKEVEVKAGHSIAIGIGLAVLDPVDAPKGSAPSAAAPVVAAAKPVDTAAPAADGGKLAPTDAGVAAVGGEAPSSAAAETGAPPTAAGALADASGGRSLGHPDLTVPIGETFRVYDPHPPSTIAFQLGGRCPSGAELTLEGLPAVRGQRELRVSLGPAIRPYTVRCLGDGGAVVPRIVARGIARVLRGDGARPLPKSAPRNSIDLDGRHYTLMYQNVRPIIAVTWPGAPKAGSYAFSLKTPDGHVSHGTAHDGKYVVESDALRDGTHALWMEAQGAKGVRSKETLVDIVFDNAAPTASVELPKPGGFAAGASTRVVGVAISGSRISVGGENLPLDHAFRFAETVALRPDQTSLAIRFQHPTFGVRYYLRRVLAAR